MFFGKRNKLLPKCLQTYYGIFMLLYSPKNTYSNFKSCLVENRHAITFLQKKFDSSHIVLNILRLLASKCESNVSIFDSVNLKIVPALLRKLTVVLPRLTDSDPIRSLIVLSLESLHVSACSFCNLRLQTAHRD